MTAPPAADLPAVLGHSELIRHLWELLATDRLHHAWLFEGPAGVGRRLVATRLAMAACCTAAGPRPCGTCAPCRSVASGAHPDVILVEPDPESASRTIPVARIREVVRQAGMHRYAAARRFVIIDPAEALNEAASNALLKTLEEPNEHTHFVLITRHASGLLPTIVSRCQRLRFSPVPEPMIVDWLTAAGHEAAAEAARLAEGCPGAAAAWTAEAIAARRALRDRLLAAIGGDLEGLFGFTEALAEKGRAASADGVEATLALLEDLLRDAIARAASPDRALRHEDLAPMIDAWATALWPGGFVACEAALRDCRLDLAANVTQRTALDALLTRVATELGAARRVSVPPPA